MSSLAAIPRRVAPGPARAALALLAQRAWLNANLTLGLLLAGALTLFAFTTGGGVDLEPNTWAEVLLVVIAAALFVAAIALRARGPAWGAITVALFAALSACTAVSIAWSVQPDNSWVEANRTASYLAAFAAALLLARLAPARWPAVVSAVAAPATVLSAYALLVKVFPATFDPGDLVGRVKAPFDYWNAVGLAAALGVPGCLWAGSRTGARALRALCVPALSLLLTTIVLSYSRSALLAAIIGTVLWFVLVPLRLRAAATLACGAGGAAILTVWALSTHALTRDGASMTARITAGHGFGIVLVLVLVLATAVGFGAAFATDRLAFSAGTRHRIGTILIVAVALVPAAGLVSLATSSRGPTGEISHVWHRLTNSTEVTGDVPGRLVKLGSSRSRYWSEAMRVGDHALLHGVGAGGYGIARTHYSVDPWIAGHAHSYVAETFADLGLIGIALSLALLVAWGLAAARTLRGIPRTQDHHEAGHDRTVEYAGMATLLCTVIVFGVSSAIDWTWFVPGTAVPALICAGWLAGRGPLHERIRLTRVPLRAIGDRPGPIFAAAGVALLTLLCVWAIWQPLASEDADAAAIAALGAGNGKAAVADAQRAIARDPVAVEPHYDLSAIYSSLGNETAAHAQLVDAIHLQPENPGTWLHLGLYDLQRQQPRRALAVLRKALNLDRSSTQTTAAIAQATAALRAQTSPR